MTGEAVVGIDLGTTNSVVAHADAGGISVLPNGRGESTTPSVVAFTDEGPVVGRRAVNQSAQHPDRTVFSVKRRMGEPEYRVDAGGESYRPEEVSALILERVVADAAAALDRPVTEAVVTVPAYFNHRQREATKRAGNLAGLEVRRLLNEPTAACLAHGLGERGERRVFVYDLGGGTFDASLVRVDDGLFEVLATDGRTDLGGDDWDAEVVSGLVAHVHEETGVDVTDDPQAMQRLWDAARRAKHDLSSGRRTTVRVPYLLSGDRSYTLERRLSRDQFESMTAGLLDDTAAVCEALLDEAGVAPVDVDEVVLVGGATRMPQVAARLESLFGQAPARGANPDEVVAVGAAAQAGVMADDLPEPAAGGGAPARSGADLRLAPADGDGGDAPARSALDDVVLLDVTAKTLGVEAHRGGEPGHFFPHVERNSTVPATASDTYHTVRDGQTAIDVPIYQGESEMAADNEFLGEFTIEGIPPAPAGEQTIEVTFELDRDGVLSVTAESEATGGLEGVTIESGVALSEAELEAMREGLPEVVE